MNRILNSILSGWLECVKPDVIAFSPKIVKASVEIFFKTISDLLPTPIRCHYTFNLRDPAKMLQGMLMVETKKGLSDRDSLLRLWTHEMCRQFRDRLINNDDRTWFNKLIVSKMS